MPKSKPHQLNREQRSTYANRWVHVKSGIIRMSETRPHEGWIPKVAASRVSAKGYRPYVAGDGSPEWVAAANALMRDDSRRRYENSSKA